MFATTRLGADPDATAPDGSAVRLLLARPGGSVAHFELTPGAVSVAVRHRTVDEIWFFVAGRGRMWRCLDDREETVVVEPGTCLTIPVGTAFQFRADGPERLAAVGVTLPPWPGEGEAVGTDGPWTPTVGAGPGLAPTPAG
jgi:mannose-6-phosphate isomerase-like protein (cupin superfamily)